ncbi:MAG: YkgJ family cysteine cluster protein [Deltaproteobacteria bacterium]|nr:YkgJ family cysteine cluster protein [Deltaproteobacteria bacterium]
MTCSLPETVTSDQIFQCRQCGDCCKGYGGTYVSEADIERIGKFIHEPPARIRRDDCCQSGRRLVLVQGEDGFCIFRENNLCAIHPVKPRMCRAWPFIQSVVTDPQNWYAMAGSCPGMRTDFSPHMIRACVARVLDRR